MELETITTEEATRLEKPPDEIQDLPPEFCHYQDDGCELAPACLACPYEKCVYDEPGGRAHRVKDIRNREISRLYYTGKGIDALAAMFGVSERTIHRALKRGKE